MEFILINSSVPVLFVYPAGQHPWNNFFHGVIQNNYNMRNSEKTL